MKGTLSPAIARRVELLDGRGAWRPLAVQAEALGGCVPRSGLGIGIPSAVELGLVWHDSNLVATSAGWRGARGARIRGVSVRWSEPGTKKLEKCLKVWALAGSHLQERALNTRLG